MLQPDTRCVVCTHASNVTGAVLPIREIYEICQREGIVFILDAAQTAGVLPVSLRDADIICTAGHKGLLGIQGSGMMILRPGLRLGTLMEGGTGIRSLERDMRRTARNGLRQVRSDFRGLWHSVPGCGRFAG